MGNPHSDAQFPKYVGCKVGASIRSDPLRHPKGTYPPFHDNVRCCTSLCINTWDKHDKPAKDVLSLENVSVWMRASCLKRSEKI